MIRHDRVQYQEKERKKKKTLFVETHTCFKGKYSTLQYNHCLQVELLSGQVFGDDLICSFGTNFNRFIILIKFSYENSFFFLYYNKYEALQVLYI